MFIPRLGKENILWLDAILLIYTTKGTSSPILRRSEEIRDELCDMKI